MRPKLAAIVAAVEQEYGLPPRALYERNKSPTVVQARQVAMWLARQNTIMSYPEIGVHFHQMHHTSIMNGVRKIERQIVGDSLLFWTIHRLCTTYHWRGVDVSTKAGETDFEPRHSAK